MRSLFCVSSSDVSCFPTLSGFKPDRRTLSDFIALRKYLVGVAVVLLALWIPIFDVTTVLLV